MRTPDALHSLVDHGIIDDVVRPLMSGKEAQIYLVISGGEQRVAKIYKEAQNRSFQNKADYTEGRKVRNSRDQRAMGRGSRHGKAQSEAAWRSAEVDMIYRLRDAGVRVPTPYHFIDGVLIMELVRDVEGFPAPRLGDLVWEPEDALGLFQQLLGEVVRMLSAGVVHGDLSDFNVLMSGTGPVVIDFPQSVEAATNANARKLLIRDVDNLHRFASKFAPTHQALPYAQEMWELYKRNALTPETQLTGRFKQAHKAADTNVVLDLIADANKDERRRREGLGMSMRGVAPEPVDPSGHAAPGREQAGRGPGERPRFERGPAARAPAERRPAGSFGERTPARVERPQRDAGERGRAATPGDRTPMRVERSPSATTSTRDGATRDGATRDAAARDVGRRDAPRREASPREASPRQASPREASPREASPRRDFGYRSAGAQPDGPRRDVGERNVAVPPDAPRRDFGHRSVAAQPDAPRRDFGHRSLAAQPDAPRRDFGQRGTGAQPAARAEPRVEREGRSASSFGARTPARTERATRDDRGDRGGAPDDRSARPSPDARFEAPKRRS